MTAAPVPRGRDGHDLERVPCTLGQPEYVPVTATYALAAWTGSAARPDSRGVPLATSPAGVPTRFQRALACSAVVRDCWPAVGASAPFLLSFSLVGWWSPRIAPLSVVPCASEPTALLAGPAVKVTAATVSNAVAAVIARDGVRTS